jgi:hypothetical protein
MFNEILAEARTQVLVPVSISQSTDGTLFRLGFSALDGVY